MGRASRLKRVRNKGLQGRYLPQSNRLLMTLTNEPFQPVRLYYSIPERALVTSKLGTLECMMEAPEEHCLQWLFHAEATSLRFGGSGYEDIPKERRPIILGRIRFPTDSSMILQTNSIARAIGAASFFAPYLGPECTGPGLPVSGVHAAVAPYSSHGALAGQRGPDADRSHRAHGQADRWSVAVRCRLTLVGKITPDPARPNPLWWLPDAERAEPDDCRHH